MNRRTVIQDLWAAHRETLQAFFRRRHPISADAEDLTQEVYLRLLRTDDYAAIDNPEAYLFTIARNLLIERSLRDRRESERLTFADPLHIPESTLEIPAEHEADHKAQLRVLREAIDDLKDPLKAALLMAYEEELTYSQIAERLNVHRSMVGKYLAQAIDLCRQRLNGTRGTV
jgi:RNA polymerase sigma-70 factor (ECF subfamily)